MVVNRFGEKKDIEKIQMGAILSYRKNEGGIMVYDKNGLGYSELAFIAVNLPEIFDTIQEVLETEDGLEIARKSIDAYNLDLIDLGE